MQSSQLTAIANAKRLLEECGCFRGPQGPEGPQGPQGPQGTTLFYYSDGVTNDPNAENINGCIYGLFIGADGYIWRSSPSTQLDSSFTASYLNGSVNTITKQSDGKILVGGAFTFYGASSYNYIIRFNTNGSIDSTFNVGTGFNNTVQTIVVQPDDKILVGGAFQTYNASLYKNLIRLNSDGSIDTSFFSTPGFDGTVYSIALQSDGKIVVGGAFEFYNSISSFKLIRLTSAGNYDGSFSVGAGFGSGTVFSIALANDDTIYVAGNFSSYNSITVSSSIAHILSDGSLDTSIFVAGTGVSGTVYYIKFLTSNSFLIAGSFSSYNGTSVNNIAEISINGTLQNTYGSGFNGSLTTLNLDLSSNLLVGGTFTTFNGSPTSSNITRLNSLGNVDTSYPFINGFNNTVNSIYVENSSNLLVGGNFTSYNNSTTTYLTRLKETECSWINTGTNILGASSNFSTVTFALTSTVMGLGSAGYISSSQLTSTVAGLPTTLNLTSTVIGLGTIGYISTLGGGISQNNITSTIIGLGTFGYVSTSQLRSTAMGLGSLGYISSQQLISSVLGLQNNLGTLGYVSSSQLVSTVNNLSRLGYISSTQLASTVMGLGTLKYISSTQLTSTVTGLGTLGYISSSQLTSSIAGIPALEQPFLTSSLIGLGTFGYISSSQLTSSIAGIPALEQPFLTSSLIGLGTLGYISSSQLTSSIQGIPALEQPFLTSSLIGLGTFRYISSSQLTSSIQGIPNIEQPFLTSSIIGLGSIGYISSAGASQGAITSSIIGLGTFGYISTSQLTSSIAGIPNIEQPFLTSSIIGLGSIGYISSSQLISTVRGLGNIYLSTFNGSTTFLSSAVANISSLTLNSLTFGTGVGWVDFGAVRAVIFSSIQTNTGLLNASSITGDGSQIYNLPAISTLSLQSTVTGLGTFGYLSTNTVPSTIVGLGTFGYLSTNSVPSTIVGLGTFGYISSASLYSSIQSYGFVSSSSLQSSLIGLGTFGYISSASLYSSIQSYGFVSSSTLQSSLIGLGNLGYISSTQLTSSIIGLGSIGYISSSQLISTVRGLGNIYLSTFNGSTTFLSSAVANISSLTVNSLTVGSGTGFVDFGAIRALLVSSIQTNTGILNASSITGDGSQIFNLPAISSLSLQSTIVGLGTFGYISTSQLVSTTLGLVDHLELNSTIIGLGTFGYVSSFNSISSLNISTGSLFAGTISTLNINASTMTLDKLFGGPIAGATTTQNLYPFSAGANIGFGSNTAQGGTYAEGHFRSTFTQVIQPTLDNDGFSNIVRINGNVSSQQITTSTITANNILIQGNNSNFNYLSTYLVKTSYLGASDFGPVVTGSLYPLTSNITQLGFGPVGNGSWWRAWFSNVYAGAYKPRSFDINSTINLEYHVVASTISVSTISTQTLLGSNLFVNTLRPYNSFVISSDHLQPLSDAGYEIGSRGFRWGRIFTQSTITNVITPMVGVTNPTPGIFDINSTIRMFGTVSTQNIQTSTINIQTLLTASSIIGDGSQIFNLPAISSLSLQSTIVGLGTFGYISSSQLISTVRGLGNIYLSSFNGSTTFLSSAVANISSLTVNSLTVGTGGGWVDFGAIRAVIVSSIQTNTSLLITSSITGDGSQIFNLPAISTLSLQSTIVGLGTFGYISSQQLTSSITGIPNIEQPFVTSSLIGLGTFGYISTSQLTSSIIGLGTLGYISSSQLTSSVEGLISAPKTFIIQTFTF